jgi:hypothetical protein
MRRNAVVHSTRLVSCDQICIVVSAAMKLLRHSGSNFRKDLSRGHAGGGADADHNRASASWWGIRAPFASHSPHPRWASVAELPLLGRRLGRRRKMITALPMPNLLGVYRDVEDGLEAR